MALIKTKQLTNLRKGEPMELGLRDEAESFDYQYGPWSALQSQACCSWQGALSAAKAIGDAKAAGSLRLFMVPGMGHCRGGEGPNTLDMMVPLEQGVEKGLYLSITATVAVSPLSSIIVPNGFDAVARRWRI